MFKIYAGSFSRDADFEVRASETLCTQINVYEELPSSGGDIVEVKITSVENSEIMLQETWMVLWGTAQEITDAIRNDFPMAKIETETIYNYIDRVGEDISVMLTYPTTKPTSPVILRSPIYKTLRSVQQTIVSQLYKREFEGVAVLNPS